MQLMLISAQCDVEVVYFDPVHDFAFLQYDPSKIRYASIQALELKPEAAQVGVEVRVVGNDSGEVLTIASAVISRLDRNAPTYSGKYHDFNTNYIQAAAVAKGGSSGSPVVDINGFAVALQAGGKVNTSATNFFLPLQRVARALNLLQKDEEITRGTIQTQWRFESFDICRRLGLSLELEDLLRQSSPGTNTMLVADRILPNGPAHGKFQKGDLLLKVNGATLLSFIDLDDILDTHVGRSIAFDIRRGDQDIKVTLDVGDLHAITPRRFVRIADAVFHDLSYQIARYHGIPCQGVYSPYHGALVGLPDDVLIDSVNGLEVTNLDRFLDIARDIKDTGDVKIAYRMLTNLHTKASIFVSFLRCWHPKLNLWTRDHNYRRWSLTELDFCTECTPSKPKFGTFPAINGLANLEAAYIANTIVKVSWTMEVPVNGNAYQRNSGHGLIVNAEEGLVVVARSIVLHELCSITLNIANIEVPAHIKFLHPLHNYALIKYNPEEVDAPMESARLSKNALELNQKVTMICVHKTTENRTATETSITDINSLSILGSLSRPQYRAVNFEALNVETRLALDNSFGVIVEQDGSVGALWLVFQGPPSTKPDPHGSLWAKHGLQAYQIRDVVERYRTGSLRTPRFLDFETQHHSITSARKHGVQEHWLRQIAKANSRHLVYAVKKLSCRPARDKNSGDYQLRETDMVITLNEKLVTDLSVFGELYYSDNITATVVRDGKEMTLSIPTTSTEHLETSQAVLFCGALIQQPHYAVRQLMSSLPSEVYVCTRYLGTPAKLFNLPAIHFITHINDTETPDLDTFVKVASEIPDNTFFRLRTVSEKLIPSVTTIKKFDYYVSADTC